MQAQGKEEQGLEPVVAQPEVGALMAEHPVQCVRAYSGREVDPGAEQAKDEGGGDAVALPITVPAHGGGQAKAQPEPGQSRIPPHPGHTCQPYPEQRVRRGGSLRGDRLPGLGGGRVRGGGRASGGLRRDLGRGGG